MCCILAEKHNIIVMVKRTATFMALAIGSVFSYISVICWILGYLIAKYGGGRAAGIPGRIRSIVIPIGKFRLHLHHWLLGSLMMCVGLAKNVFIYIPPEVFYGMLGGFVWQGVYCYSDWYRVIYRSR